MKRTTRHIAATREIIFCAYEKCTDEAGYHGTPLCREHAAQVWKVFEDYEPEYYRQIVRGEAKAIAAPVQRKRYLSNRPGTIYYLQVGDRVKIGFTTDLYRRMMQYPPNSTLLATHPGTPMVEKEMHQDFRRHLADGREWFHPNAELDAHIRKVQEKYPNTTSIAEMRQPLNSPNATLRPASGARKV